MQNKEIKNRLFPVFLKLEELDVLLVGGGNVGLEKLSAMLNNSPDTKVTMVADMFRDELREYVKSYPNVKLIERARQKVMQYFLRKDNIGLDFCRQIVSDKYSHKLLLIKL